MKRSILFVCLSLVLTAPLLAAADAPYHDVQGHPDVVRKAVTFWSDGTRLAGDVYLPKGLAEGEEIPAIVLCHGWGGLKAHLGQQIAPRFATAGFAVLAFDYRGWGESDSRLIVEGEMPKPGEDGMVTVTARAVREIVDPLDQQEDIDAAITFMEGEPHVDASRIGIWGSSFGGGHVIWRAAHDDRVGAVVAQVAAMDQRMSVGEQIGLYALHRQEIARVRGELPPIPLDADMPEGLRGTPYYERFAEFSPVSVAQRIEVPTLIIDAELEHYFPIEEHGGLVYQKLTANGVPAEYHVLEGRKHYDVYRGADLDEVMELEIAFFKKHLRGEGASSGLSSTGVQE